MCGITGIVLRDGEPVTEELIRNMTDSMTHRGPDDEGIHIHGNVGLGMRRLSIMDVVGGSQPLFSKEGSIAMVGNGEIYNYRELAEQLKSSHQFRTSTDMEVVAPMYQKYGLDFPKYLEGMFGLAVLDKQERKLHLIRDRMGIKPLFVARTQSAVVFSSDINSIIRSGKVSVSLNHSAASNYFKYRFGALETDTFFKEIECLLPGQTMTIDISSLETTIGQFHDFMALTDDNPYSGTEDELVDELDKRLRASVSKRLMSDVPLGTLLSSGIDSTLLTALANDINPTKVDAFTIGYAEKGYDESLQAKESADHLGIKWHRHLVSNEEYTDLVAPGIVKNEAPIAHPNSLAVHLITDLAKSNGYKVLLSGEGADELFAGYGRTVDLDLLSSIARKYPKPLLQLLIGLGIKFNTRERRILASLLKGDGASLLSEYFSVGEQSFLPDSGMLPLLKKYGRSVDHKDLIQTVLQIEQRTYLQELLLRQDKMSMWSSMEVRVPFVGDPVLVEFANRLPLEYKLKNGVNKYLLRKVAARYLPEHICHRKKKGFGSPIGDWLRQNDKLLSMAHSLATSEYMDRKQKKYYSKLLDEHTTHKADHYEMIWKIMNYLIFRNEYRI